MHKEGGEAGEETEKLKEPPEAWKLREGAAGLGSVCQGAFLSWAEPRSQQPDPMHDPVS